MKFREEGKEKGLGLDSHQVAKPRWLPDIKRRMRREDLAKVNINIIKKKRQVKGELVSTYRSSSGCKCFALLGRDKGEGRGGVAQCRCK